MATDASLNWHPGSEEHTACQTYAAALALLEGCTRNVGHIQNDADHVFAVQRGLTVPYRATDHCLPLSVNTKVSELRFSSAAISPMPVPRLDSRFMQVT